jgi:hypothetical protein
VSSTLTVRWSTPIQCRGADASPIPARGGVYEILCEDDGGLERMYVGQCEDLRRAFVSHIAGTKGEEALRRGMREQQALYRYWEQESLARRLEVVAALTDLHYYEWGHDEVSVDVSCVTLNEVQ